MRPTSKGDFKHPTLNSRSQPRSWNCPFPPSPLSWPANLRLELKQHLDAVPLSTEVPKLYAMYEVYHSTMDAEVRMSPRALSSRQMSRQRSRQGSRGNAPASPLQHQQQQRGGASANGRPPVSPPLAAALHKAAAGGDGGAEVEPEAPAGPSASPPPLGRSRIPSAPIAPTPPPPPGDGAEVSEQAQRASMSLADDLEGMDEVLMSTTTQQQAEAIAAAALAAAKDDDEFAVADRAAANPLDGTLTAVPPLAPDEYDEDEDAALMAAEESAPLPDGQEARGATTGERAAHREGGALLDHRRIIDDVLRGAKLAEAGSHADAGLACRLLQALRWRLVRSRAGPERWGVLTTWIEVDLMRCHGRHGGHELMQVRGREAAPLSFHLSVTPKWLTGPPSSMPFPAAPLSLNPSRGLMPHASHGQPVIT